MLLLRVGAGSLAELVARSVQPANAPWLDLAAVTAPLDINQLQATQGGVLFVGELARLSRAAENLAFALDRLERYDLRLVVATDRSLEALVGEGWEEGLLARLFEVSLAPPSVADVREDLPELASQMLLHLVEAGQVPLRRSPPRRSTSCVTCPGRAATRSCAPR